MFNFYQFISEKLERAKKKASSFPSAPIFGVPNFRDRNGFDQI